MEKPGLQGFDLVRIKCKNLTWEVKENRSPSKLRVFILEVGAGGGVSMLRWGGSSPAPPAPQCMPSPNKLPSHSAALPPETLCFLLRPRQAHLAQHKGCLSLACEQCHKASWGRGEAAGPRPGVEGAEGLPLALRAQDLENHILGRPGIQSHRSVSDEVVGSGGPPSHLDSWV